MWNSCSNPNAITLIKFSPNYRIPRAIYNKNTRKNITKIIRKRELTRYNIVNFWHQVSSAHIISHHFNIRYIICENYILRFLMFMFRSAGFRQTFTAKSFQCAQINSFLNGLHGASGISWLVSVEKHTSHTINMVNMASRLVDLMTGGWSMSEVRSVERRSRSLIFKDYMSAFFMEICCKKWMNIFS